MSRSQAAPSASGVPGMQRLIREPGFAQTSLPLQAFVSAQSAAPEQVQVQSFWHPSPFTMLPSSHCSGAVTMASPQRAATQPPPTQIRPAPQLVPVDGGVPAMHRLARVPGELQVSAPLHAFPSLQSAPLLQVHVQSASHPSPLVVFPSSQSSAPDTTPSPQPAMAQVPPRQMRPPPQLVPSLGGVPAAHMLAAVPGLAHVSAPLQTLPSSQSAAEEHVKVQSFSQPSPSTAFPSSHCSEPSVKPSPQADETQPPLRQMSPLPQLVPSDAGAEGGTHRLRSVAGSVHVSTPLQISASSQSVSAEQVKVQLAVHPSASSALPSSHSSPASTRPLPQRSFRQLEEQPSPSELLPSSHSSLPSSIPLPQSMLTEQSALHSSPSMVLPSSQTSPAPRSTTPFPQLSSESHAALHPSPLTVLPSSQTSSESAPSLVVSTTPFPQR